MILFQFLVISQAKTKKISFAWKFNDDWKKKTA